MLLEARGLSRHVGERLLYKGISITLERGDTLAIQGPSGAGKSLLLRQLAGLDPIETGELFLQGRSPAELGYPAWRAQVTYVAQHAPVGPGSPAELLAVVASLHAQAGRKVDDAVACSLRWGIQSAQWEQPWSTLSGGEQLRIALAIAVSRRPAVLLLDEPTGALDPATTLLVEADLAELTTVWVSHDPAQAKRVGSQRLVLG